MTRGDGIRALILYMPVLLAVVLWLVRPRYPRQFAACLMGALWAFPSLLILQLLKSIGGLVDLQRRWCCTSSHAA